MRLFIPLILTIAIYIARDILIAMGKKHKSYEEMMKDPAFAWDSRLQAKLNRRVDNNGDIVL